MSKVLDDVITLSGDVEKLKRENEALKQALKSATKPDYERIAYRAWYAEPNADRKWLSCAEAVIAAYNKHESTL